MFIRYFILLLLCLLQNTNFCLAENFSNQDNNILRKLLITRITPQGIDVPAGNQITIHFSKPIVDFGDMDRDVEDIPIIFNPHLNCQWKWLNTNVLACNLNDEDKMKPSTAYEMIIEPEIRLLMRMSIEKPYVHRFITERPKVSYSQFNKWLSPVKPQYIVKFNQPILKNSIEKSIFFVNEKGKHIAVNAVINDHDNISYDEIKLAKQKGQHKKDVSDTWLISPSTNLPKDNTVVLKVKPGLSSSLGKESSIIDQEIAKIDTFPEFKFVGVSCYANGKYSIVSSKDDKSVCDPQMSVSLSFTAPVVSTQVKSKVKIFPELSKDNQIVNYEDYSQLRLSHKKGQYYYVPLSSKLDAAHSYNISTNQLGYLEKTWLSLLSVFNSNKKSNVYIQDEFGRSLTGGISASFATDYLRPDFNITGIAVLPEHLKNDLVVNAQGVSKLLLDYEFLKHNQHKGGLSIVREVSGEARYNNVEVPVKIRDILQKESGVVLGNVKSEPKIQKNSKFFAQVTPYQIQAKVGHFNTLLWVTDLKTGNPVSNAKVTLYKDSFVKLNSHSNILESGITNEKGILVFSGLEKIDPELKYIYKWKDEDVRLFIKAEKGNHIALLPLNYEFLADRYQILNQRSHSRRKYEHIQAFGITAQGVYRRGDKVQYKVYVRNRNLESFISSPKQNYSLQVINQAGNVIYNLDNITLSDFGSFSGEFNISKQAKGGWYRLLLSYYRSNERNYDESNDSALKWEVTKFLVSDFTPAIFKVNNKISADVVLPNQELLVDTSAEFYSGGEYVDSTAQVRTVGILKSKNFYSKNSVAKDFTFNDFDNGYQEDTAFEKMDFLNTSSVTSKFVLPKSNIKYGELLVESAVMDDKGKYISTYKTAEYFESTRLVGLKVTEWPYKTETTSSIKYVVVDYNTDQLVSSLVNILIEKEKKDDDREKSKWAEIARCEGMSSDQEGANCNFKLLDSGYYRATATVKDDNNSINQTKVYFWATGQGKENDNLKSKNLEIIAFKDSYNVGETAKYMVKNYNGNSQVLVTVEHHGVIDSFLNNLQENNATIEVPIKPEYAPGFYLSITVPSVLNDEESEDNGYRSEYIKTLVNHQNMEIKINTDKNKYHKGDRVKVKISAKLKEEQKKEPIELAVAVVDKAVSDLIRDDNYFDIYKAFYRIQDNDVANYNLLNNGKNNTVLQRMIPSIMYSSGLKVQDNLLSKSGSNDGDLIGHKSNFKLVSYWNSSLITDKNGDAEVEFTVPDNLTSWNIIVCAVNNTGYMAFSNTTFQVHQPIEITSAMANQVVEGDKFNANFIVINHTDHQQKIDLSIKAMGNIDINQTANSYEKAINLLPYEKKVISMPIFTKIDYTTTKLSFIAIVKDENIVHDYLTHDIPVQRYHTLQHYADYNLTKDGKITEFIQFPQNIDTQLSSISFTFSPTVLSNMQKVFSSIKDNELSGLEPAVSKAIVALNFNIMKNYFSEDFQWENSRSIINEAMNYIIDMQAPNGGMSYFVADNSRVDPYLSAYTALAINQLEKNQYSIPQVVKEKLFSYLNNFLNEDFPKKEVHLQTVEADVRAVVLSVLSENNKAKIEDLQNLSRYLQSMSLFGKSYYLKSAINLGAEKDLLLKIISDIMSYTHESSGKISFIGQSSIFNSRTLSTNVRNSCAILNIFSSLPNDFEKIVSNLPLKLLRSILQSKREGNWTTQESAFCTDAFVSYSKKYEQEKPNILANVTFTGKKINDINKLIKFTDYTDRPISFKSNIEENDLGKRVEMTVKKEGSGYLYYNKKLNLAYKGNSKNLPINSGIEIRRDYRVKRGGKYLLLKKDNPLRKGELVKVDIFISTPVNRNFVLVNDRVPGGLEPLNVDLATTSLFDSQHSVNGVINHGKRYDYHEIFNSEVKFYYQFLPKGRYHISYNTQSIAAGEFTALPAIAQEIYECDIYGQTGENRLKFF